MKSVEPLSPRAYQLAEEYQLGEPRAEFRNAGSKDFGLSVLIALGGAIMLFACV